MFLCPPLLLETLKCHTKVNQNDRKFRKRFFLFTYHPVCFPLPVTIVWYTGCPRRNVPDFGRVFLMLKYTDITQNTHVQSWMVTEIMAREKCGLLAVPRTVRLSWLGLSVCPWVGCTSAAFVAAAAQSAMLSQCVTCSAWNSKDNYDNGVRFFFFFVFQFNGFTSLTS
jgi:hypothetical protein